MRSIETTMSTLLCLCCLLASGCGDSGDPQFVDSSDSQVVSSLVSAVIEHNSNMEDAAFAELRHRGARTLPAIDEAQRRVELESATIPDPKQVTPEQFGNRLKALMDVEVILGSLHDVITADQ